MYVARFAYDVAPSDRERAIELIRSELSSAREAGYRARMLVPMTRPPGGSALFFEVELGRLDELETFRHRGAGHARDVTEWARDLSDILVQPPSVEILRVAEDSAEAAAGSRTVRA